MNYTYYGIYMREPSGLPDHDRCWVYIGENDCSLVIKVPSSYTEDEIKTLVESIPDPNYVPPEPPPEGD